MSFSDTLPSGSRRRLRLPPSYVRQMRDLDEEIRAAVNRVDAEEAAWLVAIDGSDKIGMVFGELASGEVNVRIWIHPAFRKQGYGTAALRKSRSEMAAYFPAVPLVVRAPAAGA